MEFEDIEKEEEKRMRKKILSNLGFIGVDLGQIERLDLKPEIRKIIEEIRERVEMLKRKLLREENGN